MENDETGLAEYGGGKGGELTPIQPNDNRIVEIQNLILSRQPIRQITLGELDGLQIAIENHIQHVMGIFWNEHGVSLMMDNGMEVIYRPEIHPATAMFLEFTQSSRHDGFGSRVFMGMFEPVQFSKRNLLDFLNEYAEYFDESVTEALKNLRVTERRVSKEVIQIDELDEEKEIRTEEESSSTNLPKSFSASLPLFEGQTVNLDFTAKVVYKKKEYGGLSKQKVIEVTCVNPREALREAWEKLVARLPEGIPRYYGKIEVKHPR